MLYTSLLCLDDCTVLLGYSISIIVAIITLLYCIYVVQDYFDALQHIQVKEGLSLFTAIIKLLFFAEIEEKSETNCS